MWSIHCRESSVFNSELRALRLFRSLTFLFKRLFIASFAPAEADMDFLHRAQRQENAYAEVLAAVPGPREAARIFGASVTSRGIQPLFVRITNRS